MGARGALTDGVEIVDSVSGIPEAVEHWLEETKEQWSTYWGSDVSKVADVIDVPVLKRLFEYRNELKVLSVAYSEMSMDQKYITDDRGITKPHPSVPRMNSLEKSIREIEKQFGLDPASRARLKIEVGSAELTWDQVRNKQEKGKKALPVGKIVS